MKKSDVQIEFDKFFEFAGDDKSQVSSTSCKLFAVYYAEKILRDLRERMENK